MEFQSWNAIAMSEDLMDLLKHTRDTCIYPTEKPYHELKINGVDIMEYTL